MASNEKQTVYVLTESRAYYDNGSQTDISTAVFATYEGAKKALKAWIDEAFRDWYGVLSLSSEQKEEYWQAVKRRFVEFADERLVWSINDCRVGE